MIQPGTNLTTAVRRRCVCLDAKRMHGMDMAAGGIGVGATLLAQAHASRQGFRGGDAHESAWSGMRERQAQGVVLAGVTGSRGS
ncbi:hypothetical protein VFPFJ_07976 [Purpureocillium lilacinum]|uniref:Uncharacterized protein n=1 Tax=Purpureocillium lilacinum TaxID=33203 RepID=A0A179H604_PURLI|nr:hypothetical protein VFPFJ_07976 [Purpureocillium lilacinum]OAQ85587.1 hypothetical protein VFPFJ_07976 [Purpureocillium lilacinum]